MAATVKFSSLILPLIASKYEIIADTEQRGMSGLLEEEESRILCGIWALFLSPTVTLLLS